MAVEARCACRGCLTTIALDAAGTIATPVLWVKGELTQLRPWPVSVATLTFVQEERGLEAKGRESEYCR